MVSKHLENIDALIKSAIESDALSCHQGGFIALMGKSHPTICQDIPVAFEMYTLLNHYLTKVPFLIRTLSTEASTITLEPSLVYNQDTDTITLLITIPQNTLSQIAFWLADAIPSATIKQHSGLLALPFSIETHAKQQHLLPEWFAAFYLEQKYEQCIPILTLKSVIQHHQFETDWVDVAFQRMTLFNLPYQQHLPSNS